VIQLKIKINNEWIDKSEFVQLPINIVQSLDDTMDRGEVTLNFTQDNSQYEPYNFVFLSLDGREYYMMIESDTVTEINEGLNSFFKHDLVLIEATQYLATIDLHDFSTTQFVESYEDLPYSPRISPNVMKYNVKFFDYTGEQANWRDIGTAYTANVPTLIINSLGGIYKVQLTIDDNLLIKPSYAKDTDTFISLPKITDASFFARLQQRTFGLLTVDLEESFNLAYDELLLNVTTNTTYNVSSLVDASKRVNLSLLPNGSYRYIVKTKTQYWNLASNNAKLDTSILTVFGITIPGIATWRDLITRNDFASVGGLNNTTDILNEFYYPFTVSDTADEKNYNITVADALLKALNNSTVRKLNDSRYYRAITTNEYNTLPFVNTVLASNPGSTDPVVVFGKANSYDYTTRLRITEGLDVYNFRVDSEIIQGLVNMSQFDTGFDSPVYYTKPLELKYDQEILDRTASLTSLDFTFAGGKNLLEVLFELGKSFGGIPRVFFDINLNPVISFDILEELINNPDFDDAATLTTKVASTSNYATNVISEVKNFITQDDLGKKATNTIVYPSKSSWVTPRAIDFNTAIMRPDTMKIAIDDPNHGIFKIVKLEVTNFDDANTVKDITEYVHESVIFDTFPNAVPEDWETTERRRFKGLALYYRRGENGIFNLNEITDEDNIFGLTGTKYAIRRILINAGIPDANLTKAEVLYQYRIEYVPLVTSARLFVEQSNVTLENKSINMPYNQSERNVSLSQFFQAADNVLKRNGIPSISKNYIFRSVDEVPAIGQKIDFDGYDYYADKITISYDNNNIICDVQFSREVNKVDPLVGFNKEYREYSLATDNILWKRMNINNYAYITSEFKYVVNSFDPIKAIFPQSVMNLINGTFSSSMEKIEGAVFNFYDKNANVIRWDNNFEKIKPIGLSVVSAPAGNSMMFTTSMYDNFGAGRKMERIPYDSNNVAQGLEELIFGENGLERNRLTQQPVRYVDDNGKALVGRVMFLKRSDTLSFNPLAVPEIVDDFKNYTSKAVLDESFLFDKDNREALQLTYQLHFISRDKDIDVRPAFTKYNKLITQTSELPVEPGNLIVVGVRNLDSIKNKKTYEYDANDVLLSNIGASFFSSPNNFIGLIPGSVTSNKNTNYEGFALVFPGTKEIAIVRKKPISLGTPLGSIYIAFSEEIL
jgi:hypothetical protein